MIPWLFFNFRNFRPWSRIGQRSYTACRPLSVLYRWGNIPDTLVDIVFDVLICSIAVCCAVFWRARLKPVIRVLWEKGPLFIHRKQVERSSNSRDLKSLRRTQCMLVVAALGWVEKFSFYFTWVLYHEGGGRGGAWIGVCKSADPCLFFAKSVDPLKFLFKSETTATSENRSVKVWW